MKLQNMFIRLFICCYNITVGRFSYSYIVNIVKAFSYSSDRTIHTQILSVSESQNTETILLIYSFVCEPFNPFRPIFLYRGHHNDLN